MRERVYQTIPVWQRSGFGRRRSWYENDDLRVCVREREYVCKRERLCVCKRGRVNV